MTAVRLRRRTAILPALGILSALFTLILAPPHARSAERLRIGLLMPLSGDLASFTPPMQNGVILAARFAYEASREGGLEMELVGRDSHTDVTAAVEAAGRLVGEDRVSAVIGPVMSESALEVAGRVTVPARVPLITPSATAADISNLDDDGYVFRTVLSDEVQGDALAQVAGERGYRRVGVIHVNNLYGKGLARSFKISLERSGGSVTAAVPFNRGQLAYRPELVRALEDGPDALLVVAYPEDGVRILKQAAELKRPIRLLLSHTMKDAAFVARVGADFMNGAWGTAPAAPEGELNRKFREAYREMFGALPETPYIDTSFDATVLLALAAARGRATDGTSLRNNLAAVANPPGEKVDFTSLKRAFALLAAGEEIDYQGISGPVEIDGRGDVVGGMYGVWTVEDGAIRNVLPRDSGP